MVEEIKSSEINKDFESPTPEWIKSGVNPWLSANFFSRYLFLWAGPFLALGKNKNGICEANLYPLCEIDSVEALSQRVGKHWSFQISTTNPSLTKALIQSFIAPYNFAGIFYFIGEFCVLVNPLVMSWLVDLYSDLSYSNNFYMAIIYTALLCFSCFTASIFLNAADFLATRIGMQIRIASCALLYEKILNFNQQSLAQTSIGQVINIMSNDVQRFDRNSAFFHYLWIGPGQAIAILFLLYRTLGYASFFGIVTMVLFIPLQVLLGHIFGKLRLKIANKTDERVKIVSEILRGIRAVKIFCWEPFFNALLYKIRRQELVYTRHSRWVDSIRQTQWLVLGKLSGLVTLTVFVYFHWSRGNSEYLLPANIFFFYSLMAILETNLMIFLPLAFSGVAECKATTSRISDFLLIPNQDETVKVNTLNDDESVSEKPTITFKNIFSNWNSTERTLKTLNQLNFSLEGPQLVAIIGPVGAGKSSLLLTIMNELIPTSGSVEIHGKLSYAAQQPWVFAGTIRDNIIFGNEYNEKHYKSIIRICCLEDDLNQFRYGDFTHVGERGCTISGGQKARIALARAVYSSSNILLLDDPLSAVDAKVATRIFHDCIRKCAKERLCVLVTHQVQFLPLVDRILLVDKGQISFDGTFEELKSTGFDYRQVISCDDDKQMGTNHTINDIITSSSSSSEDEEEEQEQEKVIYKTNETEKMDEKKAFLSSSPTNHLIKKDKNNKSGMISSLYSLHGSGHLSHASSVYLNQLDINGDIPEGEEEELQAQGTVQWKHYARYLHTGGHYFYLFIIFCLYLLTTAVYVGCDICLAVWTEYEAKRAYNYSKLLDGNEWINESSSIGTWYYRQQSSINNNDTENQLSIFVGIDNSLFYLRILAILVLLVGILATFRSLSLYRVCVNASRRLHSKMFTCLLRSSCQFFDVNPSGRILNRYSKDVGSMDDQLPIILADFSQCLFLTFGVLFIVIYTNYFIIFAIVPLYIVFMYLRWYYLSTARKLKRLESVSRSPLYSHITTSLQGLTTIRAARSEITFNDKFSVYQDDHTKAFFLNLCATRWFACRLDWLCCILTIVVCISCLLLGRGQIISSGSVGLVLSNLIGSLGLFQWCVRQSTEVENAMVSVERVIEYTNLIPEANLHLDQKIRKHGDFDCCSLEKDNNWPAQGMIELRDICLRYRTTGPLVLDSINLIINAGERIGIVGRTGAGKSSLLSVLFRLTEPTSGTVWIDGVNILTIGLHELRNKISIIPQDPVLFTGNVRMNLDPTGKASDMDIWDALKAVQLDSLILSLSKGLESPIQEGGSNLSVGQKQLICLARAILKRNRILVIDEATANVDQSTESVIQATLRNVFHNCTVITIAHRLNTIIDSDRVVVMHEGRIVECGEPYALLQHVAADHQPSPDLIVNGILLSLVKKLGKEEEEKLLEVARTAFERKKKLS